MSAYSGLLETAHQAADMARELMVQGHPPATVRAKGDRDMVSEVDFAIERKVRNYLRKRTPSFGFLGEEEGVTGEDQDLVWAFDPVDGTANFVHGVPLCGTSLGLLRGKQPVLGVVDLPFLKCRYSASQGEGAYANGQRVQASRTGALVDALVSIGDYAVGHDAEAKNRARLDITTQLAARVQRVRMFGSAAIDLVWVAEGKIDASVILSNEPWDTSAGAVIAREAGARVMDTDGSDHSLESAATIAACPTLADEVLSLLMEGKPVDASRAT